MSSKSIAIFAIVSLIFLSIQVRASGTTIQIPSPDCYKSVNGEMNLEALTPYLELIARKGCAVINDSRRVIFSEEHGKLSFYWSQHEIGSTEMDQFIKAYDLTHPHKKTEVVKVGLIDKELHLNSFDDSQLAGEVFACKLLDKCDDDGDHMSSHGSQMGHLIVDSPPAGMGTRVKLRQFESGYNEKSVRNLLKIRPPRVVSLAIRKFGTVGKSKDIEAMQELAEKTIVVQSIGNHFPRFSDRDPDMVVRSIRVGSLEPSGIVSHFSSESEKITVVVPSGSDQMANGPADPKAFWKKREATRAGGTSGAEALTAGAVANVISFLPDLTRDEAEVLLQKTAIPVSATALDSRKVNGQGSLNAYKLVRIAALLKENWPESRSKIQENAIYNFGKEAESHYERAMEHLRTDLSCKARKKAFLQLRLGFFLEPEDRKIRAQLAEFYENEGFNAEALFYRHPLDNSLDPMIVPQIYMREAISAIGRNDVKALRQVLPKLVVDAESPSIRAFKGGLRMSTLVAVASAFHKKDAIELLHSNGYSLNKEDKWNQNALSYSIVGSELAPIDRPSREIVRETIHFLVEKEARLPERNYYIQAFQAGGLAGLTTEERCNFLFAVRLLQKKNTCSDCLNKILSEPNGKELLKNFLKSCDIDP